MSRTAWVAVTAEPYRILLTFGILQLIAALIFWNAELVGRHFGLQMPMALRLSPGGIHGLLMLYTIFPFFIFGFLMTTYPRWLDAPPVPRSSYIPAALLLGTGTLVFYAGVYGAAILTVIGMLVLLGGYVLAMLGLLETQRRGRIHGRLYERYLHIALLLGAVGILLAALALHGRPQLWPPVRTLGLWGFLLPVLVTMSHRMLPFLTSCVAGTDPVSQPRGGPHAMLILIALHGLLELAGQPRWLWLVDFPLALIAAHHLRCWAFARCLRARLLAMLHIAFAWFVGGMLLYGIASLLLFFGQPDHLGRAPLHALGMGFALAMTFAMITRIARVHIGLAPVAVSSVWLAFWVLNGAVLLRIGAELMSLSAVTSVSGVLLITALLLWAVDSLPLLLKH